MDRADPLPFFFRAHAPDYMMPLHFAASSVHLPVVTLLVEAGAEVSAGVGSAGFPLHFAARKNNAEVIAYLPGQGQIRVPRHLTVPNSPSTNIETPKKLAKDNSIMKELFDTLGVE